jgi:hypothetical protein
MLGRFINREGLQKNSPTARFGHISQMPGDPIDAQEEAFLCEVRSIGGYSGSPVFVLPAFDGRPGGQPPPTRGIILGVDFCHIQTLACAQDNNGYDIPHIRMPQNTGMAGVIPAWRLQELIMSDKALQQRRAAEESETRRRNAPKVALDADAPPATKRSQDGQA